MSDDVVEKIVTEFSRLPIKKIQFIWHGGEPLMAGRDFYTRGCDIQEEFSRKGIAYENSLQTNATLIDHDWVDFFIEKGIRVGVSLDGPDYIHDAQRVDLNDKGSFDRVLRGVKLLRSNNYR